MMQPCNAPPVDPNTLVELAADRLEQASRSGIACSPVRDLLGTDDLQLAYSVQDALTMRRRADRRRVVGRKIGVTSRELQHMLGVSEPTFGMLFDDMACPEAEPISTMGLLQPHIEAEVAFVLAHDLTDSNLSLTQVREAIAYVQPALEIADSRTADWNVRITDVIADNSCSGLFVLGSTRMELAKVDTATVSMSLTKDGAVVSRGDASACLGDPLTALTWLANALRDRGVPLRAGEVVLSGALAPMIPVEAGCVVTAEFSGLGSVCASFAPQAIHESSSDVVRA